MCQNERSSVVIHAELNVNKSFYNRGKKFRKMEFKSESSKCIKIESGTLYIASCKPLVSIFSEFSTYLIPDGQNVV